MSSNVQWDPQLMNSMMFLYKTRLCPILKNSKSHQCPFGNKCFDKHSDKDNRRRPVRNHDSWNYSNQKCTTGYPNTSENCRYRNNCGEYHTSTEFLYHPMEYKTKACNDREYKLGRTCSRGCLCWGFHDQRDRRNLRTAFIPVTLKDVGLSTKSPPPEQFQDFICDQSSTTPPPQPLQPLQPPQPPHPSHSMHPPPAPAHMHLSSNQRQHQSKSQPSPSQSAIQNNVNMNDNVIRNKVQRAPPPPAPCPLPQCMNGNDIRNPSPAQCMNDNNDEKKDETNAQKSEIVRKKLTEYLHSIGHFFYLFKIYRCPRGDQCPKGTNCMSYHSNKDRRRPFRYVYVAKACPEVFDYLGTGDFRHDLDCPNGDECTYAHNQYELLYHQRAYKVTQCPYYKLTGLNRFYDKADCPFIKDQQWFQAIMSHNPIKKVRGNVITHVDGQHTCIDYCCFWHEAYERRYKTDPDIVYDKRNKPESMTASAQATNIKAFAQKQEQGEPENVPPHMMQQEQEPQQPMPAYGPQRQREKTPPHYHQNERNNEKHEMMHCSQKKDQNEQNNVSAQRPPHEMNYNANRNEERPGNVGMNGNVNVNKGMSRTDLDQKKSEKAEFANNTGFDDQDDW